MVFKTNSNPRTPGTFSTPKEPLSEKLAPIRTLVSRAVQVAWTKELPDLQPDGGIIVSVDSSHLNVVSTALLQAGAQTLGPLGNGTELFLTQTGVVVALGNSQNTPSETENKNFLASRMNPAQVVFRPWSRDKLEATPVRAEKSSVLKAHADEFSRPLRVDPFQPNIQHLTKKLGPSPSGNHSIHIAMGYRKDANLDTKGARGEDHVAERSNARYVCCVVADGVSSSFYGAMAAEGVSEHLVKFLWERREKPPSHNEVSDELRHIEQNLKKEVDLKKIPDNLPSLMQQSMNLTRPHGSQAKFAAVLFDSATKTLWRYQVGDVHVTLERETQKTQVAKAQDPKGAVASTGRVEHHLETAVEYGVIGFTAYTDGIDPNLANSVDKLMDEHSFVTSATARMGQDDQSFIAVKRAPR